MQNQHSVLITLTASLTALAALGTNAPSASAAFIGSISVAGATAGYQTFPGANSNNIINFTGTVGAVSITGLAAESNSTALPTPSEAKISDGVLQITNNDTGTDAIIINISDNFSFPGAPAQIATLAQDGSITFGVGDSTSLDTAQLTSDLGTTSLTGTPISNHTGIGSVTVDLPNQNTTAILPTFSYPLGSTFTLTLAAGDSADLTYETTVTVPEPATWGLLTISAAGMVLLARRRHRPAECPEA